MRAVPIYLPVITPYPRLGILGPYLYHFIPFTTYLCLPLLISVRYLQGYSFSTCLLSSSMHVTSRSHMGLPNMMFRVLLRQNLSALEMTSVRTGLWTMISNQCGV